MAWIKAGTVAISNGGTTATGTGTSWLTGVNAGDALIAPDGRVYEITAINSATSLTIAPAYLGSGVSGAAYIIAPTRGLTGTLADRVQQLITDFGSVKDEAGASKMADFIRYLSDQDTGWQRVASNTQAAICGGVEALRLTATGASGGAVQSSNTDATAGKLMTVGAFGSGAVGGEISDFSAAIVNGVYRFNGGSASGGPSGVTEECACWVAQGANGRTNFLVMDGRNSLAHRLIIGSRNTATGPVYWSEVVNYSDIIGTVSQSGGVPTGGIIERSSNANGEYTRWADGTQICEGVVNTSGTAAVSRTWPAAFSGVPRVALSSALTTAAMATVASTSATSANFYMWNHDGTQRSGYVGFIAKGTWF